MPTYSTRSIEAGGQPAVLLVTELAEGATTPDAFAASLASLSSSVPAAHGVVLSGRIPLWGAAMLCHHFHPTCWVGTYDPRLGGAVVVQSHTPGVRVGQVLPFDHP
ncbi:MAG: hypothetical protein AMXMBFR81_23070 [Chthonomonas sp.]